MATQFNWRCRAPQNNRTGNAKIMVGQKSHVGALYCAKRYIRNPGLMPDKEFNVLLFTADHTLKINKTPSSIYHLGLIVGRLYARVSQSSTGCLIVVLYC